MQTFLEPIYDSEDLSLFSSSPLPGRERGTRKIYKTHTQARTHKPTTSKSYQSVAEPFMAWWSTVPSYRVAPVAPSGRSAGRPALPLIAAKWPT